MFRLPKMVNKQVRPWDTGAEGACLILRLGQRISRREQISVWFSRYQYGAADINMVQQYQYGGADICMVEQTAEDFVRP